MTSTRLLVLLLTLIGITIALKCYTGNYQQNIKPTTTTNCPTAKYCTKIVLKNDKTSYYGCDMTNICKKDECIKDKNDDMKCCCSKDLCNSSSKFSAFFTIIPIAMVKLFV